MDFSGVRDDKCQTGVGESLVNRVKLTSSSHYCLSSNQAVISSNNHIMYHISAGETDQAYNLLWGRIHMQRRAVHHNGAKGSVEIWTIFILIYLKVRPNIKLSRRIGWGQLQAPIHEGEGEHFFDPPWQAGELQQEDCTVHLWQSEQRQHPRQYQRLNVHRWFH